MFWIGLLVGIFIGCILTFMGIYYLLRLAGKYYGENPEALNSLFENSWDRAIINLKKEGVDVPVGTINPFK